MFSARIIGAEEAMAVFGLVRLCYPEIEPQAWREHLARLGRGQRRRAGCVVVADQRGYAHAACLFRVVPDPRAGRRLEISYLSKAELPASRAPDVLFAFVDELAQAQGCAAIVVHDNQARIAQDRLATWTGLGTDLVAHHFKPGTIGFEKTVPAAGFAG
jgi:hypothetical protein